MMTSIFSDDANFLKLGLKTFSKLKGLAKTFWNELPVLFAQEKVLTTRLPTKHYLGRRITGKEIR